MTNEASYNEFRERAVRYLSGEMGGEERRRFDIEIAGDPEKQRIFGEYRSIWDGVDQLAAQAKYDLDAEWDQLSEKLSPEEGQITINAEKGATGDPFASSTDSGAESKLRTLPRRTFLWRIAAVLVAGLAGLAGWLALRNQVGYEQVASRQGSDVVILADGSVVTLNAGSTLKYNMDEPDQRRVILEGEAFFEVAKDTARPFIVEAGSAVVEVLGTSFNINAYDMNGFVEVTVATGLVTMGAKHRLENQIILNPGNSGIYDKKNNRLELITSSDPNAIAWKTREIVFSETPLIEVVRVISHVYQARIRLGDASLSSCPITVSFHDQELGAVLSVITSTLDLEMERREGVIVLSGEGCD